MIIETDSLSLQKYGKVLDVCVSHAENINKHCFYATALCRELTETGLCGGLSIIYRRWREFRQLELAVVKLLKKRKAELGQDPKILNIPSVEKPTLLRKATKYSADFTRSLDDYLKFVIKLPCEIFHHPDVHSFFRVREDDISKVMQREPNDDLHLFDISNPVSLENYVVRADFTNPGPGELEIHTGEEVEVIQKSDTGWWLAESSKGSGWVPSSYLETDITNYPFRPGCEEFHVVTKSYKKTLDDELTLPEGAIVQVLDRNDSGWWSARFAGRTGLVPGTNLYRVNTIKAKCAMNALGVASHTFCPLMAAMQTGTESSSSSSSSFSSLTTSSATMSTDLSKLSSSMDSLSLSATPPEGSAHIESVDKLDSTRWTYQSEDGEEIIISNYELFQSPNISWSRQEPNEQPSENKQTRTGLKIDRLHQHAFDNEGFVPTPKGKTLPKIVRMENQSHQKSPLIWRTMQLESQGHGLY